MLRFTSRNFIAAKNVASTNRSHVARDNWDYFPAVTLEELRQQSKCDEVGRDAGAEKTIEFLETDKVSWQEYMEDADEEKDEESMELTNKRTEIR